MNGLEPPCPEQPAPAGAPSDGELLEGASFPWVVKVLATVLVAALVVLAWRLGQQAPLARIGRGEGALLFAALAVVAAGYGSILAGRTGIGGGVIRQRWLWAREVRLDDITQLKLIHAPRLSWIVVPRLVVRSRGVGLTTFQTGDPRVLAAFRRLASGGR